MKIRSVLAVLTTATILLGSTRALADTKQEVPLYLYEAAQSDLNLFSSYNKLTAPVFDQAGWLVNYGTAYPAQKVEVDNTEYLVFFGCMPHYCPSQSYAVIYEPKEKKMLAGAFVTNTYEGQKIKSAELTSPGD